MPGRQETGFGTSTWPLNMPIAPNMFLPVGDTAFGIELGTHIHHHRRALGLPGKLVVAHPLHADRGAGYRACEQHGIKAHIVGTVMPIATRAFGVTHHHSLGRQFQQFDDFVAQGMNGLRGRPDVQLFIVPPCQTAGRADRSVRQVGAGECRRVFAQGCVLVGRVISQPLNLSRLLTPVVVKGLGRRQRGPGLPLAVACQTLHGADGLFFALRDDAQKAAITHHSDHPRQCPCGGFVYLQQHRAYARWANDATVDHAGQLKVMQKSTATQLGGQVFAGQ